MLYKKIQAGRDNIERRKEILALESLGAFLNHEQSIEVALARAVKEHIPLLMHDSELANVVIAYGEHIYKNKSEPSGWMDQALTIYTKRGEPIASIAIVYSNNVELSDIEKRYMHLVADILSPHLREDHAQSRDVSVLSAVGGLIHQQRTPLGVQLTALSHLQTIIHSCVDAPTAELKMMVEANIQTVMRQNKKANAILDKVLAFGKIESGSMQLVLDYFNLKDHVELFLQDLAFLAKDKKVALDVRFAEDFPRLIVGDKHKLEDMIQIFVENAIKFAPRGAGQVRLVFDAFPDDGDDVLLSCSVEDNGPGFPEEAQAILFSKYGQAKNQQHHTNKSSGLGLWMLKEYALLMDGTVEASNIPSGGARFSFIVKVQGFSL